MDVPAYGGDASEISPSREPLPPRHSATASAQAVLPRDVSHFLVDFSIALHRQAMYPPRHPTLVPALHALIRRAEGLLENRLQFVLGVARDRLVIEGAVTDVRHPLLRGLADRLHRHDVGALAFSGGVTTEELLALLAALSADPDTGRTLGASADERQDRWPHIRVHPLRLDRLGLVDRDSDGPPPDAASLGAHHRCAQLWVGLAHAAAGGAVGARTAADGEPLAVARAIDEHEGIEAYDQVIGGYLRQIAEELRTAAGADALELRRRTSRLVAAMRPETLRRLLAMGGDALQRRRFLRDAAMGLTGGAVVELVKAAAESTEESVSSGLVRMLSKLAAQADEGPPRARPLAETALRDQVHRLLSDWELADPNPADYTAVLQRLSTSGPADVPEVGRAPASSLSQPALPDRGHRVRPAPADPLDEPLRLVEMSLELDEDTPWLWQALDVVIASSGTGTLLGLVAPPREAGSLAARVWAHVTSCVSIRRMLDVPSPDLPALDAVLSVLDRPALTAIFDRLADTDDRGLRRELLARLRRVPALAGPMAIERLEDSRWYVLRNLLHLLSGLEPLPDGFDPRPHLRHPDARVRREGLRVALRTNEHRAAALEMALADEDASVLGLALTAAARGCPRTLAPRLLALAQRESLDDHLRAHAVRALTAAGQPPGTVDVLLRLGARGVARSRAGGIAGRAALAALTALTAGWQHEPRARDLIARAARSDDSEVRSAVGVPR